MTKMEKEEPKATYIPSDKEKKVLDYVYDRVLKMQKARDARGLEADWNKWIEQCAPGGAEVNPELHIKNPDPIKKSLTREAVFGVLAMAIARNNEIQLIMADDKDAKLSLMFQKLSDYVSYVSKEPVTIIKNLLTTIMLGTGVRKRIYRCDTRKVKDITSYNPETEEIEYTEKTIKDYDDCDVQDVSPFNFLWDERATCNDDMRDCAEWKIVPFDSFLDEYPTSKYKRADLVRPGGWIRSTSQEKQDNPINPQVGSDDVEVIEYTNKTKDLRLIIADGVPLTEVDSPIPYKHKQIPYTISVFQIRDAKRLDGVGLPELVEQDQKLLDGLLNSILVWVKLIMNKPVLKGGGDQMEGEGGNIELEAGKVIDVNDVNNYKFWDIPGIDRSVFEALDREEKNAKLKVGLDDPMGGVKSGGTATESAIAAQASKEKVDLFFKFLEEEVDVRDEWLKLNVIQQFYSEPTKMNPIIGEDGEPAMDEQGQPVTEPQYRKLPIGIEPGENEFGNPAFNEKKDAYTSLKPEYLGVKDGKYAQFTVRVASRSTSPISKELRQQKWNEFLKTANDIAAFQQLADWKKLWDKTGEIYEFDSDEFSQAPVDDTITKLAQEENDRMMKGEQIPSTQGATEEHTAVHMALADSTDFDNLDPAMQKVILDHAKGEVAEQRMKGGEQTLIAAQDANAQKAQQDAEIANQIKVKGAGAQPNMATNQNVNMGGGVA